MGVKIAKKEDITKEQFETYNLLRMSGSINMCDVKSVCLMTSLERGVVLGIMRSFLYLNKKFSRGGGE